LMGRTQLFLQFTRQSELPFSLKDINLSWVGAVALVIIVARLIPLFGLRRTTAVSIKQERTRGGKRPLWERYFLDFLLLIPAGYAYWILRGQLMKPVKAAAEATLTGAQGQYDPLMFVASSLFAIAACMIVLRFFPLLMRLLAKISERFFPAGSYLAIQELARRPQGHSSVMLLIMISLSLAIYSASMAKTLDQWMHASQYYQAGADLVIKEYEIPIGGSPGAPGEAAAPAQPDATTGVESLVSLEEHLKVPGIRSATNVGKYDGLIITNSAYKDCQLMAIDRLTFPTTAYFRRDFTSQSLGTLMNALAAVPNGVLVPQSLLESTGLRIGDPLQVSAKIGLLNQGFAQTMMIVGAYTYFPSVYPTEKLTLIVNIGNLFGSQEAATGYEVWLNLQDKARVQTVLEQLRALALKDQMLVSVQKNALDQIQKLLDQPEWVGLFGILSVGFLLTGLMPCIGFVLDSFASLRRHFIQLGILMAIGLPNAQVVSYLVLERLFLMGIAMVGGTIIGFTMSLLFLPLLQISTAGAAPVPPFEVLIGWTESIWLVAVFAVVLLIAVIGTIAYLVQIKIFQAVKMGESI
jgi:putative ABC transport system permease protein